MHNILKKHIILTLRILLDSSLSENFTITDCIKITNICDAPCFGGCYFKYLRDNKNSFSDIFIISEFFGDPNDKANALILYAVSSDSALVFLALEYHGNIIIIDQSEDQKWWTDISKLVISVG